MSLITPLPSISTSSTIRADQTRRDTSNNFMTLLVTQLQNQNPLDPMQSSEMLNQLTAMTSVSELRNIRHEVETLQDSLSNARMINSSNLIGQKIALDADSFVIEDDTSPLQFALSSPGKNQAVNLMLFNGSGEPIVETTMQSQSGDYQGKTIEKSLKKLFGALPPGNYGLQAFASDGSELPVFVVSQVQGVSLPVGQEPRLIMQSVAPATLSMVRQITSNH